MGFRFSLQPVLEQRHTVEEARQRSYSVARAAADAIRARIEEIEHDLNDRKAQVRGRQISGMPFIIRQLYENWIDAQTRVRAGMEQKFRELEVKAEQERQLLIKAVQGRMIMEKLRDKELKDWRLAEARVELKQFDEIAVREFGEEKRREKDAAHSERIAS